MLGLEEIAMNRMMPILVYKKKLQFYCLFCCNIFAIKVEAAIAL